MPFDSVNFPSEPTVDGNQAKGFLDKLQQTTMQAGSVGADPATYLTTPAGAGNVLGGRSDEAARQFRDTCNRRRHRDHSVHCRESSLSPSNEVKSVESPSGDFAVSSVVSYWSVSKMLASRLKGAEASSAEIFATLRELVKFNGKTMAEASRVCENDIIKVPARYKEIRS